jgi:hypothetical protein
MLRGREWWGYQFHPLGNDHLMVRERGLYFSPEPDVYSEETN